MAENLKEVIARLKAQNSPQPQTTPQVKPVVVEQTPIPVEDEEDFEEELEEIPEMQEKSVESKTNSQNFSNKEDQDSLVRIEHIEALQNNGVYRINLLSQLDEIKRTLVVIAGVLVDLNKK